MKWEKPNKDDAIMYASAAGAALCGVHALVSPKTYQDLVMETSAGRHDAMTRCMGHTTTLCSALVLAGTNGRMTEKGVKDMHKVCAASWGTIAAHQGYQMYKGVFKKDASGYGQVAMASAVTGLHLWRSFRKDDKPKAATVKK